MDGKCYHIYIAYMDPMGIVVQNTVVQRLMEIHLISENSSPHVWSPPLSCSFRGTVPCVSSLALTPESQVRVEQVRFFENSVPLKPLVNQPVSYCKNSHLKGVDAFF